jgi:hypothetical protein
MTDVREMCLAVAMIRQHLDGILDAINDSHLTQEETIAKIEEERLKALGYLETIEETIRAASKGEEE